MIVFLILCLFSDTAAQQVRPSTPPDGKEKDQSAAPSLDELLEGFAEPTQWSGSETTSPNHPVAEPPGKDDNDSGPQKKLPTPSLTLECHFPISGSFNFAHEKLELPKTDWRGLSRWRSMVQIGLQARFWDSTQIRLNGHGFFDWVYAMRDRSRYSDEVLDMYEKELELGEAYIWTTPLQEMDIRIGRQITVWGKSDNIRVTDILNPLDLRVPGLTDLEDLRLPVTMIKLDLFLKNWSLSSIAIPEIRFNKNPPFGSDFFPDTMRPPKEDIPKDSLSNSEFAFAANGIFRGWDIAFYWARVLNDLPHIEQVGFDVINMEPQPRLLQKHARITMLGAAFNVSVNDWLLKAETAWFDGLRFFMDPSSKYSRIDTLAGVEYSGFKDMILAIELVNRHIRGFKDSLTLPPDNAMEDDLQWVAHISKNYLNDSLSLIFLASTFGALGQNGSFQRFSVEYDFTDALTIKGGCILYHSGKAGGFRNIGDNDRLFLELKYSFVHEQ